MNIIDTNLFGNGLLYVTFNQDQGMYMYTVRSNNNTILKCKFTF